ncbi:cupin domain-containing protein [Kribbella sandramycini]|uniref:Cupin domain-containing protein n=1 Tax=Kribbella sandramycini TaxID=60450 RepID=A0A7Y4L1B1_9ACTN|nr:cupin domain-containing protein [Kribbella sandramycini]MBB6564809.1 mannose-6-phosphate isomerase-like protein (cupin superfamily) [Kribbella sandramycini]NOL42508.1 cupin domain-containing protein [Kribbella sandramycini]
MTIHISTASAEHLPTAGITLLADVADTNGHLTSHRSTFTPGTEGAPPHLHQHAGELFYVLSGTLRVLTGETLTTLQINDFLFVPPNTPHAFEALGPTPAEVLFVLTQAKPRFGYYRLLESAYQGRSTWSDVAATSTHYDNHYVESPVWLNR